MRPESPGRADLGFVRHGDLTVTRLTALGFDPSSPHEQKSNDGCTQNDLSRSVQRKGLENGRSENGKRKMERKNGERMTSQHRGHRKDRIGYAWIPGGQQDNPCGEVERAQGPERPFIHREKEVGTKPCSRPNPVTRQKSRKDDDCSGQNHRFWPPLWEQWALGGAGTQGETAHPE